MRSSFFRTLLFLLPALLLLNCTASAAPELEPSVNHLESVQAHDVALIKTQSIASLPIPHLELAKTYIGTTELTGNNDGPEVEQFLSSVGLAKGNPYCAAFVSYILDETPGIAQPTIRSGLASKFITNDSISAKDVLRGTVAVPDGTIVIWKRGNTIYGHAGLVLKQQSTNKFDTIEANTSSGQLGAQYDGDGVWLRKRSIHPGNYFRITHFTRVTYDA